MTFRMLGATRVDLEQVLCDVALAERELEGRRTRIFVNSDSRWKEVAKREPRRLESIFLADGAVESVRADIALFRNSRSRYREMGIPFRRGVLLYGPPGKGESSLAGALADAFHVPLYLLSLSLSSPKLGDSDLGRALP